MKYGLLIGTLLLCVQSSLGQQFTDLRGDYLGQNVPGDTPLVFARGIVSTDYKEHWTPRFSPDGNEVFWQTNKLESDQQWTVINKTARRVENRWLEPEASPFGPSPVFSPDGRRLYFDGEGDLYFVEKQGSGWSDPKSVGLVARFPEIRFVAFSSITNEGTIYFVSYLEGAWANAGIYRSELIDGEYAKPEPLPASINTLEGVRNWTPFIAPDESYLLFCSTRGLPDSDQGDLFVSFRLSDGTWTDPVGLGETMNSERLERFPSVSPDGRYLFFTRSTPGTDEDVYWVSAGIIDKLKVGTIRGQAPGQHDAIDTFGQTPPPDTPVRSAPGLVSTGHHEHSRIVFSPDGLEMYWAVIPVDPDYKPGNGRPFLPDQQNIWFTSLTSTGWSKPRVSPATKSGSASSPAMSASGSTFYFMTPDPQADPDLRPRPSILYGATREGGEWSNPVVVPDILPNKPDMVSSSFCRVGFS